LFFAEKVKQHLDLIDGEWVAYYEGYQFNSLFQPIYHNNMVDIYAYEGLLRINKSGLNICPEDFFSNLNDDTELTNLSAICFGLYLRNFGKANLNKKLFLNIHPNIFSRLCDDDQSIDLAVMNVLDRIQKEGLTVPQIVLEITEFEIRHTPSFLQGLDRFKALGHLIAIDDYGSRASNQQRVDLLQPDIVKIDMSLIQNFSQGIDLISLPQILKKLRNSGYKVILEGIETEQDYQALNSLLFDYVQGYYFSKPIQLINQSTL
jgi:EAL domain-containing protein (putative c-di-GMP-specific phosphodiesterase class I)